MGAALSNADGSKQTQYRVILDNLGQSQAHLSMGAALSNAMVRLSPAARRLHAIKRSAINNHEFIRRQT